MRKIGLLTMALVLALGSLGLAYAAWTDEVVISGQVNTGDVDLEVVALSGSFVAKGDNHSDHYWHGWMTDRPAALTQLGLTEDDVIGTANADFATGDHDVFIWMNNIFPLSEGKWMVDMLLHYDGSVPARLHADIVEGNDHAETLAPYVTFWAVKLPADFDPTIADHMATIHEFVPRGDKVDSGVQVHYCDHILIVMELDIPQDPDLMGLNATFAAKIQAVQWNEFEEDAGFYPYTG